MIASPGDVVEERSIAREVITVGVLLIQSRELTCARRRGDTDATAEFLDYTRIAFSSSVSLFALAEKAV
jgi:hypothetical protein